MSPTLFHATAARAPGGGPRWLAVGIAVAAAAFVLDRLLSWAEARGWIYYRHRKPSITSLGTALFQLQAIVQPEKQHIVEANREIKEDEDDDGAGKPKPPPAPLPPRP